MEWIIEENCYNLESIEVIIPYFKPFLDIVLHKLNITSLDYFVIADSREDIYAETVNKYASLVGTETYITQDGVYYTAGKEVFLTFLRKCYELLGEFTARHSVLPYSPPPPL